MKPIQEIASRVTELAAQKFTPEQISVLSEEVIPRLEPLTRAWSQHNKVTYLKTTPSKDPYGFSDNKASQPLHTVQFAIFHIVELLMAAVADDHVERTMTLSAYKFKGDHYDGALTHRVVPEDLPKTVATGLTELFKLKDCLTAEGLKALKTLESDPYWNKLKGSWPYIVDALKRDLAEEKKSGSMVKSTGLDHVTHALKELLPTWTVEPKLPHEVTFTDPTSCLMITAARPYDKDVYRLIPAFRLTPTSLKFSWGRLGVDDGAVEFPLTMPVNHAVQVVLTKINKARDKQLDKEKHGRDYDFGPLSRKMLTTDYEKVVEKLKTQGTWETGPGGFGTYYLFTTKPGPGRSPASSQLSKDVGKAVYWYKQDRD